VWQVLATNGSSVRVPLHVYHGKLHYQQFSSFLHLQPPLTVTVDADGHLLAAAPPPLVCTPPTQGEGEGRSHNAEQLDASTQPTQRERSGGWGGAWRRRL
jgi:hypothetical protein